MDFPSDGGPVFRITRGTPSPEEVAALVGALASRRRPAAAAHRPTRSAWRHSALPHGDQAVRPGPGAWRTSALPR